MFEHNLKEKIFENINQCVNYFGESLLALKANNNPLFYELFEIEKSSKNIRNFNGNQIIIAQHDFFLKPTLLLLDRSHSEGVEFDENTGNLWVFTSKTIDLYGNLEAETIRLKTMLEGQNIYIKELIEDLKKASYKLRNEFLN